MAEIILKNVRLAFPDLHKRGRPPKDKPNEPGKYGGSFIFAPDSEANAKATAALIEAAKAEFGEHWQNIVKVMEKSKKFLRKGDENLTANGEVRNGFAGNNYVVARNKVQPLIIGPRRTEPAGTNRKDATGKLVVADGFPVLDEASGKPYGGCYVNLKIDVRAMKAKGDLPNQVYAQLLTVQFLADGESFGASTGTAEGFEDEGEEPVAQAASDEGADLF